LRLRALLNRRLGLALAVAGMLAISATALALTPPPGSRLGNALSVSAAENEYLGEMLSLSEHGFLLAPGWEWPDDPGLVATGPDGAPMNYEEGYGAIRADFVWFYSWAHLAVSAEDGGVRANATLQLVRLRDTLLYKKRLPEDRAYLDKMINEASQGDLTKLREYVAANAPVGGPESQAADEH
jgi:hypothetical protein